MSITGGQTKQMKMKKLRFAVIGCGFWARYQLFGWMEMSDQVELIALCDKDLAKAQRLASEFGSPPVYTDAQALLEEEAPDFVDIISDVDTHAHFVRLAAANGVHAICQKPMAPDYETAYDLVKTCREKGVRFFVHENFRWQPPIRRFKALLDAGAIGEVFKGRVTFCSAFPVFDNQPFLAQLDRFILMDIGTHILDIARYLFGEAKTLHCLTKRVNPKIKGEDVANVLMEMQSGAHCYAEMSYTSILEQESFPETLLLAEGSHGSLKLEHGYVLKLTTREGTQAFQVAPPLYHWLDPAYAAVHSSIVETNRSFLQAFQQGTEPETEALDNLKTIQLVFSAYDSASQGTVATIPHITFEQP